MPVLPISFDAIPLARAIWVAPAAAGDGSKAAPLGSIQQAVDKATPGTAIMVRAGIYAENVLIKRPKSGRPNAPIWLISADGPFKAHIVAPSSDKLAGITAGGVENWVVQGFWVTGGKNGIQFSQNGYGFDKMVRNIVIRGNRIEGVPKDGIKVNGGENIVVTDNVTRNTADQGVDFVAIVHGVIADNDIGDDTGPAAIFAKGGSQDIRITGNHVHDARADGIDIGGWMSPRIPYRAGYDRFEAKDVTVSGNRIEHVGKRPLNILGGVDSVAGGNFFEAAPGYPAIVEVGTNFPRATPDRLFQSANIRVTGNVVTRADRQIIVAPGSGPVDFSGNRVGTRWNEKTGPSDRPLPIPRIRPDQ